VLSIANTLQSNGQRRRPPFETLDSQSLLSGVIHGQQEPTLRSYGKQKRSVPVKAVAQGVETEPLARQAVHK